MPSPIETSESPITRILKYCFPDCMSIGRKSSSMNRYSSQIQLAHSKVYIMHLYHCIFFLGLLHFVLLLEVTPNSGCSSLCDAKIAKGADPSDSRITKTSSSDLVCNDYEYDGSNSTEVGRRLKDCLSCELNSTATDAKSNENDVYWALCMCQLFMKMQLV